MTFQNHLTDTFCAMKVAAVVGDMAEDVARALTESFVNSFSKSQFPHKSVNLSFITAYIKNKLTDLCGN